MAIKTLICVPLCGFANRLKFLASIKGISKKLRCHDIKVVWKSTMDCKVSFQDAFKNIPGFELMDEEAIYERKEDVLYYGYVHMNQIIENLKAERNKKPILVIEGGHECKHPDVHHLDFLKHKQDFYRSIEWSTDIEERVSKLGELPKIGIHYRHVIEHTDQADVKSNPFCNFSQNSPFSHFEILMKRCKQKAFFLSNSGYHKNYVSTNLPQKKFVVIHEEDMNDRSSNESMKMSIVEFIILSRCELIIGSYFSSFSDEASYFNLSPKYMPMTKCPNLEPFVRNYHSVIKPTQFGEDIILNMNMEKVVTYL